MSEGGAVLLYLAETWLHRHCMWACHRLDKGRAKRHRGGSSPPRIGRSLTIATGHCLCVVGRGLDLHHSPVVLSHVGVTLDDVLVILLHKSMSKAPFR
jgi:hypothetical protein